MNTSVAFLSPSSHPCTWPVDIARYDRSPDLNEDERAELKRVMQRKPFHLSPSTKVLLHRLLQPLQDVFTVTHLSSSIWPDTIRVLVVEMYRRDKTFWAWTETEWMDIIGPSYPAFARRYGRRYGVGQHPARRELPVLAYLLCSLADLDPLLGPFAIAPIARKVFGKATIDAHVKLLTTALRTWGYREKHHHDAHRVPVLSPVTQPQPSVGRPASRVARNGEPDLHLSLRARLPVSNFSRPFCPWDHQPTASRPKTSCKTSDQ